MRAKLVIKKLKKNQDMVIWGILGLPRLRKILNIRDSLSGKHVIEISGGCGKTTFANTSEEVKGLSI